MKIVRCGWKLWKKASKWTTTTTVFPRSIIHFHVYYFAHYCSFSLNAAKEYCITHNILFMSVIGKRTNAFIRIWTVDWNSVSVTKHSFRADSGRVAQCLQYLVRKILLIRRGDAWQQWASTLNKAHPSLCGWTQLSVSLCLLQREAFTASVL